MSPFDRSQSVTGIIRTKSTNKFSALDSGFESDQLNFMGRIKGWATPYILDLDLNADWFVFFRRGDKNNWGGGQRSDPRALLRSQSFIGLIQSPPLQISNSRGDNEQEQCQILSKLAIFVISFLGFPIGSCFVYYGSKAGGSIGALIIAAAFPFILGSAIIFARSIEINNPWDEYGRCYQANNKNINHFSKSLLASLDSRSENVVVHPVIVAELDLGNRHKG